MRARLELVVFASANVKFWNGCFLDFILVEMGAMREKAPARYATRNAAKGIRV